MKQLKLCNLICILNIYIHVDMTRKRKCLRDILTGEKKELRGQSRNYNIVNIRVFFCGD